MFDGVEAEINGSEMDGFKQEQVLQTESLPKPSKQLPNHDEPGLGPSARQSARDLLGSSETVHTAFVPPKANVLHHYGFWLVPCQTRNATEASVSFAILTGPAKACMAPREFEYSPRKSIVARNAHKLLDPVVYVGNFSKIRKKSMFQRRDLSIGSVFKLYLPRGTWQWEIDENNLDPLIDRGFPHYSEFDTIINGFIGDKGQPTFTSLESSIEVAAKELSRRRKVLWNQRKAFDFELGPSPLKKVYTPESMAVEEVQDAAYLAAEQEVSENIRAHYISRLLRPSAAFWVESDSDSDSECLDDEVLPEFSKEAASNNDTQTSLVPSIYIQAPEDLTGEPVSDFPAREDGSSEHYHDTSGDYSSDNTPERRSFGQRV